MGNILQVQVDLPGHDLLDIGAVGIGAGGEQVVFIAEADGRQARDAGPHQQHLALIGGVQRNIVRHLRPGAYEAHVPHQDVYQLGQLVYFTLAQEAAHGGDAAVVAGGDLQARIILAHGAELEDAEGLAALADALLPEEQGRSQASIYK